MVAGEPVVVHVRVENELKDADVDDTIVGRAGGRHTVEIIIQRAYHYMPLAGARTVLWRSLAPATTLLNLSCEGTYLS